MVAVVRFHSRMPLPCAITAPGSSIVTRQIAIGVRGMMTLHSASWHREPFSGMSAFQGESDSIAFAFGRNANDTRRMAGADCRYAGRTRGDGRDRSCRGRQRLSDLGARRIRVWLHEGERRDAAIDRAVLLFDRHHCVAVAL